MIEAEGRVVARDGAHVWVETQPSSGCSGCSAKGCGTGALRKVLGNRAQPLRVRDFPGARVGDTLVLGMREDMLVRGSLAAYLAPLAAMLAGALVGEGVAPWWHAEGELLTIAGGGFGFLLGLAWLRRYGRRAAGNERFQAMPLRISSRTGESVVGLEQLSGNNQRQEQQ